MKDQILRKLFLGFIQIHILHHASIEPIYGSWMMAELANHGYDISPGTLYPLLKQMEQGGLLTQEAIVVDGKTRKYYRTTTVGDEVLLEAKLKSKELVNEIQD